MNPIIIICSIGVLHQQGGKVGGSVELGKDDVTNTLFVKIKVCWLRISCCNTRLVFVTHGLRYAVAVIVIIPSRAGHIFKNPITRFKHKCIFMFFLDIWTSFICFTVYSKFS